MPSRSLRLRAPKTRIGFVMPALRLDTSSMSAQASTSTPAASSVCATLTAPCPYALALTTAMIPGGGSLSPSSTRNVAHLRRCFKVTLRRSDESHMAG